MDCRKNGVYDTLVLFQFIIDLLLELFRDFIIAAQVDLCNSTVPTERVNQKLPFEGIISRESKAAVAYRYFPKERVRLGSVNDAVQAYISDVGIVKDDFRQTR